MNNLKLRGLQDIYTFCINGLKGFKESRNATYPKAHIQHCIIHQIGYSTRYVGYKDIKQLMVDLKSVYQALIDATIV